MQTTRKERTRIRGGVRVKVGGAWDELPSSEQCLKKKPKKALKIQSRSRAVGKKQNKVRQEGQGGSING
jgi:hypothetical protein